MKSLNIYFPALFAAVLLCMACDDKDLPKDPVLTMPISALSLEVSGEEYTAVPELGDDSEFTGKMLLAVKVPSGKATVAAISLLSGYSSDLSVGDEVRFTDNKLDITVFSGSKEAGKYTVEMQFNPPPFFYFVKTSDRDEQGHGYFLNPETQAQIASANYDNYFEGEVDLTSSNWDNVALVSQDMTTIYNLAAGPWPAVSNYSWTAETKTATSQSYFKSEGPWNDWLATGGNEAIVSPGVWRVSFDSSTNIVDMFMTQWAVAGTAVDGINAMTFSSDSRTWSINIAMNKGSFHFETIPVTFGDERFYLGYKEDILGQLSADGHDIDVEAGNYTVSLTLSNSPYYTYTIERK